MRRRILFLAPLANAADADKGAAKPDQASPAASDSKPGGLKRRSQKRAKPKSRKRGRRPSRTRGAAAPPDEKAPPPGAEGEIKATARMKDLLGDGFLIRTTLLVPAETVTRQSGKVTSDALIVTLQKETAIAVCYYTLKAYVKEGLTNIASCTVFR